MKDYSPFLIKEQSDNQLLLGLKLKRSYRIWFLVGFRILPWVVIILMVGVAPSLQKMFPQPLYSIYYLLVIGLMGYLLLYRYAVELYFSKGKMLRKVSVFYFSWQEEIDLSKEASVEVKLIRTFRNAYWNFYLIEDDKKKQLFYIPLFFTEKIKQRDNFIELFKEIVGVEKVRLV